MTHLTREQRYAIYLGRQAKRTQKQIADEIGVSQSTVSRELRRGSKGLGGYNWLTAQEKAEASRSNDHLPWTDITNHGDVRMIAANSTNKTFKGSSGALASIKVKSAAGFSGEHQILLKNIVCSDANAARYALPDAICRINHVDSLQGDVDGNGEVNGTDLNILINIILGKDNAANYDGRANVDGNGSVDGNDLNAMINILLGK